MEAVKQCYINKVGYDDWNATQFVINATNNGLPMEPVSQSIGSFNRPTKEMERMILSKRCVIDDNPITRFCFKNVTMKIDHNGNTKPSKESNKPLLLHVTVTASDQCVTRFWYILKSA